jgi:hypothetical protein|tara:strand:- start:36790 stop:36969 length:180 start_codon:yes stop_codon:yes gene_type:complete
MVKTIDENGFECWSESKEEPQSQPQKKFNNYVDKLEFDKKKLEETQLLLKSQSKNNNTK